MGLCQSFFGRIVPSNLTVGRGRTSTRASASASASAYDFLVSNQSSQSRKRRKEPTEKPSPPNKFWSTPNNAPDQDTESEDDMGLTDPRKSEDWKIQKRKGFMKDKEDKLKDSNCL